ncbi:LytTR family DNA-binding domain-containing protein [Waltera sp.]|uniref:LytTR family DNA-binding domain-containing protein n=1 Tax=Waltera sp. TaxID=2815806 RepID=UPI0039A315F6
MAGSVTCEPLFFQTHRSFIINYEHITNFDHMLVHLSNGQFTAYLTKRKYSAFKEPISFI